MSRKKPHHHYWNPTKVGVGVGVAALAAASAAAGVAFDRVRGRRSQIAQDLTLDAGSGGTVSGAALGSLRGEQVPVTTFDGCALHVEVDDGPSDKPTMIFTHGYTLTMDSFHFQREALRDRYRLVFWDQRGHGRSADDGVRGVTMEKIGRDLAAVIEATAPTGPIVLVGHSMGGMTVMSYAAQHPQVITDRVVGVALISTAAAELRKNSFGWGLAAPVVQGGIPAFVALLGRTPRIAEVSRKMVSNIENWVVQKYSFASKIPSEVADLTAEMIGNTPITTVTEFYRALQMHDKREALSLFAGTEALVVVGLNDLMTPRAYSDGIVRLMPHANFIRLESAGHMVMLERPVEVNEAFFAFMQRVEGQ